MKSSSILDADYVSEQRIKNGILEHVAVTENYLYVPFSVGKKGARATVRTTLQFVATSKDAFESQFGRPKSIIFENPRVVASEIVNAKNIMNLVKEFLSDEAPDSALPGMSAKKFSNLVRIVRAAQKDELLSIYEQIKSASENPTRKTLLDLLFHSASRGAVEIVLELLKNKDLTPTEEKQAYSSLAFARQTNSASITTATVSIQLLITPKNNLKLNIFCRPFWTNQIFREKPI